MKCTQCDFNLQRVLSEDLCCIMNACSEPRFASEQMCMAGERDSGNEETARDNEKQAAGGLDRLFDDRLSQTKNDGNIKRNFFYNNS